MAITKEVKIKGDASGLKKAAKESEESLKGVDSTAKSAQSSIDSMTGGAVSAFGKFKNGLTGVIASLRTLKGAIIATGIGALVIAVTSVVAAFRASEEGQNKFSKLMTVIGTVVGNVVDIISDLGEILIGAFLEPQKAWESFTDALDRGYQFIKGQIVDRFKASWTLLSGTIEAGILKMRIAWNEFTGDADEANVLKERLEDVKKEVIEAADVIRKKNQEVVDLYNDATNAVKDFIAEQQREIQIAQQIADLRASADVQERELIVERAKADRKIAELREKAANKEAFSAKQRIEFLKEAGAINDAIVAKEIEAAQKRFDAIKLDNQQNKSNKEAKDEEARAEARVIELQTKRLRLQKALTAEIVTAQREGSGGKKAEEEAQTREPVKTVADDLLSLNELANKARVESAKTVADQILSIEKEATEGLKALSDDLTDKRLDNLEREKIIEQTKRDLAMNTLSLIGQLAEEGSAVGKGVAIGQTIISTIEGVQAAYTTAQKSPITLGFPAYPYIQAGLAGAFGAAQVKKILQTDPSTGSGGNIGDVGSGGGGAAAPSFNLVRGTGENQLLEGITRQQDPIQAYVVSDRVTSSAALNRNRASEASLG